MSEMPLDAARALLVVEAYRRQHGTCPTWREIGRAMRWPEDEREQRIRELFQHGLRWRTGKYRSTHVRWHDLQRAVQAVLASRENTTAANEQQEGR